MLTKVEGGVYDSREAQDGDPLAADVLLPDEFAVEDCGGLGGANVFVEIEVACVGGLVATAEVDSPGRWSPLGGEDQSGIVVAGISCSFLNFSDGEVLNGERLDGDFGVAQLRPLQF